MSDSNETFDPEAFVREAYAIAERMDLEGWKAAFTVDGIFTDNSIGVSYRGAELDYPVRQYGTAFADMHRELYDLWTIGDTVVVRLTLQGTQSGPLEMPFGTLPATGKRMDAPCADIFELEHGRIKRSDCYPEGSVILTQLGVIGNLGAALEHWQETRQRRAVPQDGALCREVGRTSSGAVVPYCSAMPAMIPRSRVNARPST